VVEAAVVADLTLTPRQNAAGDGEAASLSTEIHVMLAQLHGCQT